MKSSRSGGFEQAYNAQVAVDQDSFFIVACSLSNHPNDKAEAEPTLAALPPALGTPAAAALDNGFWSEQNRTALAERQIEPYIATGREPHHQSWQERFAAEPEPPAEDASPQIKMAYKLRTEIGQATSLAQMHRRTGNRHHQGRAGLPPVLATGSRPGRLRMVLGLFGLQSEAPTHVVLGLTAPKACQTGVQPRRNAAEHRKSTQLDGQTRRNMPC